MREMSMLLHGQLKNLAGHAQVRCVELLLEAQQRDCLAPRDAGAERLAGSLLSGASTCR